MCANSCVSFPCVHTVESHYNEIAYSECLTIVLYIGIYIYIIHTCLITIKYYTVQVTNLYKDIKG